jgi:molybdopterin-binding aldehyde dehydrogenase-like protein
MAGGVAKDGAVRIRRVVCAVDCGTLVNPDIVRDQIQSAIIFGIYGGASPALKKGEQAWLTTRSLRCEN